MVGIRFLAVLATASFVLGEEEELCNVNNCLRQVKASAFPWRRPKVDCSSFLKATVTPAPVTMTTLVTKVGTQLVTQTRVVTQTVTDNVIETETVTATVTEGAEGARLRREEGRMANDLLLGRQVTVLPSAIPYYASSCLDRGQYSSACSCIGVSGTTVTAPGKSSKVTVTVTQVATQLTEILTTATTTDAQTSTTTETATATETTTPPQPEATTFYLQVVASGNSTNATAVNGLRLNVTNTAKPDAGTGTLLTVDYEGHLAIWQPEDAEGSPVFANVNPGPSSSFLIYFDVAQDVQNYGYVYLTCTPPAANATLECTARDKTQFLYCPNDAQRIMFATSAASTDCERITLKAIPGPV